MFSSSRACLVLKVYFLFSSAYAYPMKHANFGRAASWAELRGWAEKVLVCSAPVPLVPCEIVKQDAATQRGRSAHGGQDLHWRQKRLRSFILSA